MNKLGMRASAIAVASCLTLAGAALDASAAGLGKIVVLSSLGQPLRAEIELTASREEMADMRAQLASADAFKQAGIDLVPALAGIRFAVDKRPNGQAVVRLSSERPINDPFVDMLLELNWATGRLVREYTFLLDPPEMASRATPSPVVQAQSGRPVSQAAPAGVPASSIDEGVRTRARQAPAQAPAQAAAPAAPRPEPRAETAEGATRAVQRGDTLRKIATETKPEGVSLEQMLVGLLRANRDAFDGGNMNRLRAGRILTIPEKSELESVAPAEARKVVAAQSSDWHAYRSKLATVAAQAPVKEDAARQESAGRITAKVEDKAGAASEAKDQLKVSRTETETGKPGVRPGRSEDDQVAREKAIKEAAERVALLEKNVADLQKLLEMKNQSLADLQKQASAKLEPAAKLAEAAKPEAKPAEPAKPEVKPAEPAKPEAKPAEVKPVEAAKPEAKPEPVKVPEPAKPYEAAKPAEESKPAVSEAAKPAEAIKPAEADKPAEPVKPAEAAKPAEAPKPAEPAKPKVTPPPPPPPAPEPSLLDDLLDNPMTLLGGGGILALLAGLLVARRRRAAKPEEPPIDLSSTLTPSVSGSLTSNSVFRSTGGQSVDTSRTPVQTDFSQAGPGSIDTDEVDPVAEADVYMAYGRDAQAEEILVEAKQKDPKRYAIHLKLLEIYANRKDLERFETLASELYSETGGVGADWEKAMALGNKLDPANPLYGGSGQAADQAAPAFAATDSEIAGMAMRNTVTLPGELAQMADEALGAATSAEPAPEAQSPVDLNSLDFDLGLPEAESSEPIVATDVLPAAAQEPAENVPEAPADLHALDFDFGKEPTATNPAFDATVVGLELPLGEAGSVEAASAPTSLPDLDFDLGLHAEAPQAAPEVPSEPVAVFSAGQETPVAGTEDGGVEFDVSLTESTFLGRSVPGANNFDMSSIDLDLDVPAIETSEAEVPPLAPAPSVEGEVARAPFSSPMAPPEAGFDAFEQEQVSTAVNPDFSSESTATVVNPDVALNAEFEDAQAATMLVPPLAADLDMAPDLDISPNEEVATKLDLAKAYEEMGDLEGARELLQEVLKEGDATQRDKAQALLTRIGE